MQKQKVTRDLIVSVSERIRDHLIKQKFRSVFYVESPVGRKMPSCAYRGENGNMCAVGCLIADEHYSENMEKKNSGAEEVVIGISRSLNLDLDLEAADHAYTNKIETFLEVLGRWQTFHDSFDDNVVIPRDRAENTHNFVVKLVDCSFPQ